MHHVPESLLLGASADPIRVVLTAAALELLEGLPGAQAVGSVADHRALLTTIAVGKAASGNLTTNVLVIEAEDVRYVVDHAGTGRSN